MLFHAFYSYRKQFYMLMRARDQYLICIKDQGSSILLSVQNTHEYLSHIIHSRPQICQFSDNKYKP